MQGCEIFCGTVVFFKKLRNLSQSLLTNNSFYRDLTIIFWTLFCNPKDEIPGNISFFGIFVFTYNKKLTVKNMGHLVTPLLKVLRDIFSAISSLCCLSCKLAFTTALCSIWPHIGSLFSLWIRPKSECGLWIYTVNIRICHNQILVVSTRIQATGY